MIRKKSDTKLQPIMLVVSATLLFSIGAPVSKFTSGSVFVLVFFRCLSGLAAFAVLNSFGGGRKLFKFQPKFVIGGVLYASTTLCFYASLQFTTAANATVLGNTSPFFLAVLGFIFLGEKPLKRDWFILSMIMAGIILCFYSGLSLSGSKGDLLALLAGCLFAMLAVIIKGSGRDDAMQPLIWGNLTGNPYNFAFYPDD